MRKIIIIAFIGLAGLGLTNCTKETDDRDAFLGNYAETLNGSLTFTIDGTGYTTPISETGSFSIEKSSAAEKVKRVDDGGSYEASVSGNSIIFDPIYENETIDGIDMQLTINTTGTLTGSVLNYTMNISGTGYYNGFSFPISGTITAVATKE